MNITNPYNPSQGLMIISRSGSQKYTERLDSYSQIFTDFYVSNFNDNNKFCVDSCWESGNIYYANYDQQYVKKIRYDGTELASLTLTNPFMVSVIQNSISMNSTVTYPPQDDQGCWIADIGTGKIIKADKDLNIITEINGIANPVGLITSIDGGCYVVEYHTLPSIGGNLIKISSAGVIESIKDYTSFAPAVTRFIDIAVDAVGAVWFCADDRLYNLTYSSGQIIQNYVISPLAFDDPFSSSSSEIAPEEEKHLGAIDVDRNVTEQYLYVTGGNSHESFVLKYAYGSLINSKQYYDMSFPYVIKVIQGMGSDSIYVLEDSAKWDAYGYGSSSSSSFSSSSSGSSLSSSSGSSSSSSSGSSSSSSSGSSSSSSTEIKSTSSSGSSSSSSTEIKSTSSSSSSSFMCCTVPGCVGGGCTKFSNWSFSGMNHNNSTNCSLVVFVDHPFGTQRMFIYKDILGGTLVAQGSKVGPGSITLVASGGSGLNGSVDWDGTLIMDDFTLIC